MIRNGQLSETPQEEQPHADSHETMALRHVVAPTFDLVYAAHAQHLPRKLRGHVRNRLLHEVYLSGFSSVAKVTEHIKTRLDAVAEEVLKEETESGDSPEKNIA